MKTSFTGAVTLLLLLPLAGFAQVLTVRPAPITCIHYDTVAVTAPLVRMDNMSEEEIVKTVKDDVIYRGNVEFKTGFTGIKCNEAISNENRQTLEADHVRISCLYYPQLSGDHLSLDKQTHMARLTGHVTITDKGSEKSLGSFAKLDLSHDKYIIVSLK